MRTIKIEYFAQGSKRGIKVNHNHETSEDLLDDFESVKYGISRIQEDLPAASSIEALARYETHRHGFLRSLKYGDQEDE